MLQGLSPRLCHGPELNKEDGESLSKRKFSKVMSLENGGLGGSLSASVLRTLCDIIRTLAEGRWIPVLPPSGFQTTPIPSPV